MSKHTDLSSDPKLPKSTHDIITKEGPYFGMTVPPVAERRERPRSESTYHWLTSAVFEI